MECYDHNGNVNRIHLKMVNGQTASGQHYPQPRQRINAAQQNDAINDEASGEPEPNVKQESKPAPKATSKQKTPPKPAEPKKAEAKQSTQRASTVPTFDFDNSDYLHAGESYRPTPDADDLPFIEHKKYVAGKVAGAAVSGFKAVVGTVELAYRIGMMMDDPRFSIRFVNGVTRVYQQIRVNGWSSIPKAYINNVSSELDRADRYMSYGSSFNAGFTKSAAYTNVAIDSVSLLAGGYGVIRKAPMLFRNAGASLGNSKPGKFFGFGGKSGNSATKKSTANKNSTSNNEKGNSNTSSNNTDGSASKTFTPQFKPTDHNGKPLRRGLKLYQEGRDILEIDPKKIFPSQSSINKKDVLKYADIMKSKGWGDFTPIDVVRMNDGRLFAFDHRRLAAAAEAGIPARVVIHEAKDLLPNGLAESRRLFSKNEGFAKTWEDAIYNRISKQNKLAQDLLKQGKWEFDLR